MEKKPLSGILNEFWKWIGLTPQLYAVVSRTQRAQELEEYMFPLWDVMISETIDLINESPADEISIDEILTVMAIDNETEKVLDYIAESGSEPFICRLIERGVVHLQPHARWQCAELIRMRNPLNKGKMLSILLSDHDEYVRRRAQNAVI